MINALIDFMSKNTAWLFEGAGTALLVTVGTKIFRKKKPPTPPNISHLHSPTAKTISSEGTDSYRLTLGKKHKYLREKILGYPLRDIATFYGLNTVSELEEYENGDKELPQELLSKLIDTFFINPEYFEKEKSYIFKSFAHTYRNIDKFIDEGWEIHLLCTPNEDKGLFAWPVFQKKVGNINRCAIADVYSSFSSNGGGKMNIEEIINAMIRNNIPATKARICMVDQKVWDQLSNNAFYSQNLWNGMRGAHFRCQDIFIKWYHEWQVAQKNMNF